MKYILLILLTTQMLFGQNKNNLSVNLNGKSVLGEKKFFLENIGYGISDSVVSSNQYFDMSVKPHNNQCYRLLFDNQKTDFFFIENEEKCMIDINVHTENAELWGNNRITLETKITGGTYNKVFQQTKNTLYELEILKIQATITEERNSQDDAIFACFAKIIQDYPFLGMALLYNFQEELRTVNPRPENINKYITLVKSLDKNLKTHPFVKEINGTLDSLKRLTPGGAIYDFSLINAKKEYINTFDKRGQNLLILFTSSGCQYLEKTLEDLRKNYAELKKYNFSILEVDATAKCLEYDFKLVQSMSGIYSYPWETVFLFNDTVGKKIARNYNLVSTPKSFLYSSDGVLMEVDPDAEKILILLKSDLKFFKKQ